MTGERPEGEPEDPDRDIAEDAPEQDLTTPATGRGGGVVDLNRPDPDEPDVQESDG